MDAEYPVLLHTLPPCLSLRHSNIADGIFGIWSQEDIPIGTRFGPYEGTVTSELEQTPKDGFCWKIKKEGKRILFVDAKDERLSNWLRYVNCSCDEQQQNLVILQCQETIYYLTCKPIAANTELLVWYATNFKKDKPHSRKGEVSSGYWKEKCEVEHLKGSDEAALSDFASSSEDDLPLVFRQWCSLSGDSPAPPRFPFTASPGIKVPVTVSNSPLEFFEVFFDDNIISLITTETNRYANQCLQNVSTSSTKRKQWHDCTTEEIRVFLGLVMLQGIIGKPQEKWYWSKNEMVETPFFQKMMKRDRFLAIMMYLHFSDNSTFDEHHHPHPKLKKIYELYIYLIQKFQTCYVPESDISIDKSLLLFKGRLGWKQYIPKKNDRFGIKFYMLTESRSGYVWNFMIYTGVGTQYDVAYKDYSSPTQVVMTLVKPLLGKGYCLTTDNFYTSPELCKLLIGMQTDIYGTAQMQRKGMPLQLKNLELKMGEVAAYQRGKVMCLVWKDKKNICMLSTIHNAAVSTIFNPKTKKQVDKPTVISDYNHTMGGVDRCDQNLSYYQSSRKRQKKYYKKIFPHLMDMCVWNAFVLFKKSVGDMELLSFRMKLIEELFVKYQPKVPTTSIRSSSGVISGATLRLTGRHFLKYVPSTKHKVHPQWRCVVCCQNMDGKGKKIRRDTRYCCLECRVGLCPLAF